MNLPVLYGGETIGVVGVTGDPEEVLSLAYAIKTGIETMIDHELYKDQIFMRQDRKNLFLNLILYERSRDLRAMQEAARAVQYSEEPFRVPVVFVPAEPGSAGALLEALKRGALHTKQDISCVTIDQDVLVFKVVRSDRTAVLSGSRRQVRDYVEAGLASARTSGLLRPEAVFAGLRVRSFLNYSPAYEQVRWLIAAARPHANGPVFFEEHVEDYLLSKVPRLVLDDVYGEAVALFRSNGGEALLETLSTVFAEDRNLQRAAQRLRVHRNTVYQRLQRLKDLLGVDPLEDVGYARYLYYLTKAVGPAV